MTSSWQDLTEQMLSLKDDTQISSQKLLIMDYPLVVLVKPHSTSTTELADPGEDTSQEMDQQLWMPGSC